MMWIPKRIILEQEMKMENWSYYPWKESCRLLLLIILINSWVNFHKASANESTEQALFTDWINVFHSKALTFYHVCSSHFNSFKILHGEYSLGHHHMISDSLNIKITISIKWVVCAIHLVIKRKLSISQWWVPLTQDNLGLKSFDREVGIIIEHVWER